jgi:hypothetical protein
MANLRRWMLPAHGITVRRKSRALFQQHRPLATFRIAENCPRSAANLLTSNEAFPIAVNIAKLPSVPRQILKDIPRPPNTASRDD